MFALRLLACLYMYHAALVCSLPGHYPQYRTQPMLQFTVLLNPSPNLGNIILWTSLFRVLLLVSENQQDDISVLERLFPNFIGHRNRGRDVWSYLVNIGPLFWHLTGETPETFEALFQQAEPYITQPRDPRLNRPQPRRMRPCLLTRRNRLLMTLIWLRQYCREEVVCALFEISLTTVSDEVHHVLPILWYLLRNYVRWPNVGQWLLHQNHWDCFPNALGAIDCTIHRIWRPSVRQASYYRGDKKTHFLSTIIIVDADGIPVYVKTGFPGHMNDAGIYHSVPAIGVNQLPFPVGGKLLADGGFPDTPPLINPWRAPRLIGYPIRQQMNRDLSFCRAIVEHSIGDVKVFSSVADICRHRKSFQPIIVETVCFLSTRREEFLATI